MTNGMLILAQQFDSWITDKCMSSIECQYPWGYLAVALKSASRYPYVTIR